jgi:D-3-phosphoglycerate dehydrogenase / 2-oxoglutarate reductase
MTSRVLITDYAWPDLEVETAVLAEAGIEMVVADTGETTELTRLAADVDAILTCFAKVPADVLDAAIRCRTVARYGVGVDNIDVQRATELGIVVSNVPAYCTEEVADSALLGILALARRLLPLSRDIAAGGWGQAVPGTGVRLRGKMLGVVGLGAVGQALAARAQAIGMEVLGYGRPGQGLPGGRSAASLDEVLAQADVVSLHVPLTTETRHLIGRRELEVMKPTAWLVNTARGPLIDTGALVDALEGGRIAGAVLDVTDPEPLPAGHPLRLRSDVVLTPHTAFSSDGSLAELARRAAGNVVDVLQGRLPATVVNPDVLDSPLLRTPLRRRPAPAEADDPGPLAAHLVRRRLVDSIAEVRLSPLPGGVSNDVIAVDAPGFQAVVKRALARLRVSEEWLADPARIETEGRALKLAGRLLPGAVPAVLDQADGYLVIERAPGGWRPWKEELLDGIADPCVAERLGHALGTWQHETAGRDDIVSEFGDTTVFTQLRVDPFHRTIAERHPDLADVIGLTVEVMTRSRACLVHGDYTPKNVLVSPDHTAAWVIDWEVAHVGDPTFDPAWMTGHLLLKAVRRPESARAYAVAARAFLNGVATTLGGSLPLDSDQLVRQAGCLLLARVDGKSPVDYLTEDGKRATRELAWRLLAQPPASILDAWEML